MSNHQHAKIACCRKALAVTQTPKDLEDRLAEIESSLTYLGTYLETRFAALAGEYEHSAARYERIDRRISETLQRLRQQDLVLNEIKDEISKHSQGAAKA